MSHLPVPQSSLSAYLVEINRFPLLSSEEERALGIRYYDKKDVEAAHKLVTSNLRFVVKIAYEYAGYGIRMGDLIQEGNIGLMRAVRKFNPHKGCRLISYAVWWIRATIQNFILKSWSLVKIGTTQAQRKLFYKLSQTKRAIERHLKGEIMGTEQYHSIAERLQVRDADVAEMDQRLRARDASLDEPLGDDTQTTRMDLVPAAANQETELSQAEEGVRARELARKAMARLNEREKFIVQNRLMSDEPVTLQEIGDLYHITRERARQLEVGALKKMRLALAGCFAN